MYCKYCGSQVDSDSKFCPFCGKDLTVEWQGTGATYVPPPMEAYKDPDARRNAMIITLIVAFIASLIGGLILGALGLIVMATYYVVKNAGSDTVTGAIIGGIIGIVIGYLLNVILVSILISSMM